MSFWRENVFQYVQYKQNQEKSEYIYENGGIQY